MQMLIPQRGKTPTLHLFSRQSTSIGREHTLPQAYFSATCFVGVDLPNHTRNDILLMWRDIFDGIRILANTCVLRHGIGGKYLYKGLEFVIVHPAAGLAQGTCWAPPRLPSLPLGRCIEAQADAVERKAQNHQVIQAPLLHTHKGAARDSQIHTLGQDQNAVRPFLSQVTATGTAQRAIALHNHDQFPSRYPNLAGGFQSSGSAFAPYTPPAYPLSQHRASISVPSSAL